MAKSLKPILRKWQQCLCHLWIRLRGLLIFCMNQIHLPTEFLQTCTLKEGTVIVVLSLQLIALLTDAFLLTMLFSFPEATDNWWLNKFKNDFDPFRNNENQHIIMTCYPLWKPISYAIIGVETSYCLTGLTVLWAVWMKDVHPAIYLPWLIYTGILVTINFLIVFALILATQYISNYRDITVTWDIVPTMMVAIYACAWAYGFLISIAHYRRRMIVHWWKCHPHLYEKLKSQR